MANAKVRAMALGTLAVAALGLVPAPAAGAAKGKPIVERTLGSSENDLVYTPVAPCRLLDTRSGGGPIPPNRTIAFDVASLCGVPFPDAKAAVLNFVAVGPGGPGHLTVWPWDSVPTPAPVSSVINYAAVGGLNIANGVVVPICNTATATDEDCSDDLFARAAISSTHLVVDVLGYFAPPIPTPIECTEATAPFSVQAGGTFDNLAVPCPLGYAATGGGFAHNPTLALPGAGAQIVRSAPTLNGWGCSGRNASAGTWSGTCYAVCCRVPGI
ncbi:MAG TPA: hypothetical protein VF121_04785 [Thermoanaerobaculia bacterium]|nr:hypothetical protein [Thermoanaerobaculia bacterium]